MLKLNQKENSKVFFWGCTHIFHNPKWEIWKMRGYTSAEECANEIRNKINKTCSVLDVLIHFGDGFLNSTPEQVENYLATLNPHIFYLFGNHESSILRLYKKYKKEQYPMLSDETDVYPLTYKNITFLGYYKEILIDGKLFICQHFPLKVWDKSKNGAMHCHSHNHGGLLSSLPDANDGKILDIGYDVFPECPVSMSKLNSIMDKKEVKSFDSHH